MIATRTAPVAADVREALGDVTSVRDAEPPLLAGAWGSVFHAFVVERKPPLRNSRVQVFPYAEPAWEELLTAALDFEALAWKAWWGSVRESRGAEAVFPIPPLVETPDRAISVVRVAERLAFVRPWLEWPDLDHAGLPESRLATLWEAFRQSALGHVDPVVRAATGRRLQIPANPAEVERRRLLTDGRTLVVTTWRMFDPTFCEIDGHRQRTPLAR